jgi:hypothetical protein
MRKNNKIKAGVAIIISLIMITSAVFVSGNILNNESAIFSKKMYLEERTNDALSEIIIPDKEPAIEIIQEINGFIVDSDPMDSVDIGKSTVTVNRYDQVHFKIIINNLVEDAIEIENFQDILPGNFNPLEMSNGQVSVTNGILSGDGTFDDLFEFGVYNLNSYYSRPTVTFVKDYATQILACLNEGGVLIVEFDSVADDIINPFNVMNSAASEFLDGLVYNDVNVEISGSGVGLLYESLYESSAHVVVKDNMFVDKVILKDEKPVEELDVEPGETVTFLLTVISPLQREGNYNDREYYFEKLTVTDTLPSFLEYISSQIEIEGKSVYNDEPDRQEENVLEWTFFGNEKLYAVYITIVTEVKSAGCGFNILDVEAEITSDMCIISTDTINVHFSMKLIGGDKVLVDVPGEPSLNIEKMVFDPINEEWVKELEVEPGDELEFRVNVTNDGDYDINDLGVLDFPSDIFEEYSFKWNIGDLKTGETVSNHYHVTILPELNDESDVIFGYNLVIAEGKYSYMIPDPIQMQMGYPVLIEITEAVSDESMVALLVIPEGVNKSPVIKNECPTDESEEVNPNIAHVSVDIDDPEGDMFDWVIKVARFIDKGQDKFDIDEIPVEDLVGFAEGFEENNGTKLCSVEGIEPDTIYIWMVRAIDQGSGRATTEMYLFNTSSQAVNSSPVICCEFPQDGSEDVDICLNELRVTIEDLDGDLFDWTIETSPDFGSASGTGESDGEKICYSMIDCCLEPDTTYTWFVNATDEGSGKTTSVVYSFTTESVNLPPDIPFDPSPRDNQEYVEVDPTILKVTVTDPEDESMTVRFYDASDDSLIGSDENVPSGGEAEVEWDDLEYETTYEWYATADDGTNTPKMSEVWSFITEEDPFPNNNPPDKPSSPQPDNEEQNVDMTHGELMYVELSVVVTDPDDDVMDVTFYDGSDVVIGEDEGVTSGGTATCKLTHVTFNTTYEWYAVANDRKDGITQSDKWTFKTEIEPLPDFGVTITKPLEGMLYLFNESLCPFLKTFIIGAISIEALVTDNPLSPSIDTVKIFIDEDEVASYEYNITEPLYTYYWDDFAFFGHTIIVQALSSGEIVDNAVLPVTAFIW